MPEVQLSAGTIHYEDRGTGPVLVFLHGLVMDGSVFDPVVRELEADHRCIVPTLPLGAHRTPMRPGADLTLAGFGRIAGELLDRLDLREVTLVQNDHAAGLALAAERPPRVARLVITSCEAFENYPPGLPGKNIALTARVPGGIFVAMQAMRIRPLRRLPIALGWMSRQPLPAELTDRWFAPIQRSRAIRRDLASYVRSARRPVMLDLMARLPRFDKPVLVAWAADDRVMPPEHGRRLAALLPDARHVENADSRTLIPQDQPVELARLIRAFVAEPAPAGAAAAA
jgi:pimeloyl-ACP methyl ester carboxylesterase